MFFCLTPSRQAAKPQRRKEKIGGFSALWLGVFA